MKKMFFVMVSLIIAITTHATTLPDTNRTMWSVSPLESSPFFTAWKEDAVNALLSGNDAPTAAFTTVQSFTARDILVNIPEQTGRILRHISYIPRVPGNRISLDKFSLELDARGLATTNKFDKYSQLQFGLIISNGGGYQKIESGPSGVLVDAIVIISNTTVFSTTKEKEAADIAWIENNVPEFTASLSYDGTRIYSQRIDQMLAIQIPLAISKGTEANTVLVKFSPSKATWILQKSADFSTWVTAQAGQGTGLQTYTEASTASHVYFRIKY